MLVVAPLAVLVCYDIAKKNARANILMVIIATAELYGGMSHAATGIPSFLVLLVDGRLTSFSQVS